MVDDGSNMDVSNRHTVYLDLQPAIFSHQLWANDGKWMQITYHTRVAVIAQNAGHNLSAKDTRHALIFHYSNDVFDDLMIIMIGSEAHHPEELPQNLS